MIHPIDAQLRALFQSGKPIRGLFNGLASPALVEMTAFAGYDFTIIDNEHGSAGLETTEHMLRAARASGLPALVRCLEHDIARTLDAGASGLQIPMIRDAEHAKQIADKVRYPRSTGYAGISGQRGCAYSVRAAGYGAFGGVTHNEKSNQDVMLVLMLETVPAIEAAFEIASTPGVDAVFIGPNDLAHSMGYENRFQDPAVQAMIEKGVKGIARSGKCAGVLALTPEDEQRYASWGARYFASVITGILTKALKDNASAGRGDVVTKISY
ncbi:aldolase/citrate lyase family protein [Variovorax sp. PCZ-1]|uniref:HpcH/HpaI aldolase family protein n=1 Tax=Variovorax sp. PCZ-1 TaxID=2835533 RepID=UPI001BCB4746|nr:aldolase/citrate lyase family protein [Variovorax sp. PCZ-1]MBS7807914.1 4-hydroxy-2-oxovalerate aldolase [Variovorax sp. PCZ-1]